MIHKDRKNNSVIFIFNGKEGYVMRKFTDSDIFKTMINRNNQFLGRVNAIVTDAEPGTVILNDMLLNDIQKKIVSKKKSDVMTKMLRAIMDERMILIWLPPERALPKAVPFFVGKLNGNDCCIVPLNDIAIPRKEETGIEYDVSDHINQLYAVLYSAYLALDYFQPKAIMTPETLSNAAVIWADMFNKPLYDTIGLNNREVYDAFMYFSIRFFLSYFMECPEKQVDSISLNYIGKKNNKINSMEDAMNRLGIDMYGNGVLGFLRVLFNNEITQIKGIRINNVQNSMNASFYINRFDMIYGAGALMSLCSFPYFIYTLIAASGKCGLVKDRSFDRIFKDRSRMLNRLLLGILK